MKKIIYTLLFGFSVAFSANAVAPLSDSGIIYEVSDEDKDKDKDKKKKKCCKKKGEEKKECASEEKKADCCKKKSEKKECSDKSEL